MQMSKDVGKQRPSITADTRDALANLDLVDSIVHLGGRAAIQPVLRSDVTIPEQNRRKTRHRVVFMSNAPLATGLSREPIGKLVITDAGRTKRVHVDFETVTAQICRANGGYSAAEGVARDDELVVWVLDETGLDGLCGGVFDLVPGLGEASVQLALSGEFAVAPGEDDVGDEVADVVAAADGEDDFLADGVAGYVGADSGELAAGAGLV